MRRCLESHTAGAAIAIVKDGVFSPEVMAMPTWRKKIPRQLINLFRVASLSSWSQLAMQLCEQDDRRLTSTSGSTKKPTHLPCVAQLMTHTDGTTGSSRTTAPPPLNGATGELPWLTMPLIVHPPGKLMQLFQPQHCFV